MQHSVRLSFASQSFSFGLSVGGKLQWTGFASTYRNQQKGWKTRLKISSNSWLCSGPCLMNQRRGGFFWCRLRFGVLPSVEVWGVAQRRSCCWGLGCCPAQKLLARNDCRCMQRCWFPQTLPTRQPSRCMSTDLTPG